MSDTAVETNPHEERNRRRKARAIWNTLDGARRHLGATYAAVLETVEEWDEATWADFAEQDGQNAPSSTTIAMVMEGLRVRVAKETAAEPVEV